MKTCFGRWGRLEIAAPFLYYKEVTGSYEQLTPPQLNHRLKLRNRHQIIEEALYKMKV